MTINYRMVIFSGNANRDLALSICSHLSQPLGAASVERFPDGELNVKMNDDVRGADVFIVQPTCPPVNEYLMELLLLIDCARRASAARVTVVIPYYGYARKDRKDEGRVPISAKLVANILTTAGAHRLLTVDLHATQIQGFFDIPVDHLFAAPVFIDYYRKKNLRDLCVVSPDVGGVKTARAYAKRLGADLAIVDKRRISPEEAEMGYVIGDVKGKTVLIVDDMITTGGTLVGAARLLEESGARDIHVAATHPVLCGKAVENLTQSRIREVTVTDSIPLGNKVELCPKIKVLSLAGLLAEAIRRIHLNQSVSSLFI